MRMKSIAKTTNTTKHLNPSYEPIEFMKQAMTLMVSDFKASSFGRRVTGNEPWDYKKRVKYGTPDVGFTWNLTAEACDTSSGMMESTHTTVLSHGLPNQASLKVSIRHLYNSASSALNVEFTLPEEHVDAVLNLVSKHFGCADLTEA